jgi:hypothetical protein
MLASIDGDVSIDVVKTLPSQPHRRRPVVTLASLP